MFDTSLVERFTDEVQTRLSAHNSDPLNDVEKSCATFLEIVQTGDNTLATSLTDRLKELRSAENRLEGLKEEVRLREEVTREKQGTGRALKSSFELYQREVEDLSVRLKAAKAQKAQLSREKRKLTSQLEDKIKMLKSKTTTYQQATHVILREMDAEVVSASFQMRNGAELWELRCGGEDVGSVGVLWSKIETAAMEDCNK